MFAPLGLFQCPLVVSSKKRVLVPSLVWRWPEVAELGRAWGSGPLGAILGQWWYVGLWTFKIRFDDIIQKFTRLWAFALQILFWFIKEAIKKKMNKKTTKHKQINRGSSNFLHQIRFETNIIPILLCLKHDYWHHSDLMIKHKTHTN